VIVSKDGGKTLQMIDTERIHPRLGLAIQRLKGSKMASVNERQVIRVI
jgi:hypothetical protein